jgi:hypothetical protein
MDVGFVRLTKQPFLTLSITSFTVLTDIKIRVITKLPNSKQSYKTHIHMPITVTLWTKSFCVIVVPIWKFYHIIFVSTWKLKYIIFVPTWRFYYIIFLPMKMYYVMKLCYFRNIDKWLILSLKYHIIAY